MGGYPFAVLPSAGIAWRISSEPFVPDLGFMDEFKVRASYGGLAATILPIVFNHWAGCADSTG